MLHHVEILRDIFEVIVLMSIQHLIHEVDIPEVPAGSRLVLDLEAHLDDLLHHVVPVGVLQRHDDLVDVEQSNVLIPTIINNDVSDNVTFSLYSRTVLRSALRAVWFLYRRFLAHMV